MLDTLNPCTHNRGMGIARLAQKDELLVHPTSAEATASAAERLAEILEAHSGGPGAGKALALSGGRTPLAMYELLTKSPLRDRVDWSAIDWFWSDERCVPPDHPDSNYRMAMESLLIPLGISRDRIHRMPADAENLDAAARDYEKNIRRIVAVTPEPAIQPTPAAARDAEVASGAGTSERTPVASADVTPRFDLILLGIGTDGHTASLFPGSSGLSEQKRLIIAHHCPGPNAMRMTMTFPLLLAAGNILFLACGADKADGAPPHLHTSRSTGSPRRWPPRRRRTRHVGPGRRRRGETSQPCLIVAILPGGESDGALFCAMRADRTGEPRALARAALGPVME